MVCRHVRTLDLRAEINMDLNVECPLCLCATLSRNEMAQNFFAKFSSIHFHDDRFRSSDAAKCIQRNVILGALQGRERV
jgi:hypothetical protein